MVLVATIAFFFLGFLSILNYFFLVAFDACVALSRPSRPRPRRTRPQTPIDAALAARAARARKPRAAAPAAPKPLRQALATPAPAESLELLPEDGLLAAIPLALAMAAVGGSAKKDDAKASYAAKPQAKEAWLKYKVSARKRREAEAAQRRAEEEAALRAAAEEAALAAQREVLIHAKMPELEEPCDPLDELCKANYENESDDAWLAQISGIIADSSAEE